MDRERQGGCFFNFKLSFPLNISEQPSQSGWSDMMFWQANIREKLRDEDSFEDHLFFPVRLGSNICILYASTSYSSSEAGHHCCWSACVSPNSKSIYFSSAELQTWPVLFGLPQAHLCTMLQADLLGSSLRCLL